MGDVGNGIPATILVIVVNIIQFFAISLNCFSLRGFRWKQTSEAELAEVDSKILSSMPCVSEKKMVQISNDQHLWSTVSNPKGQGTPLLMVHGMGGGVGLWSMNLDALSENRPVYAFDLLGFGRSSRPRFSTDPVEAENMFVNSIEAYREKMGLDKVILLGHSLGGYLCCSYTIRYPQHVKHLILADPWGMTERPNSDAVRNYSISARIFFRILSPFNPMATIRGVGPWGPSLVRKYRPGLAQIFSTKWGDDTLLHQYVYHCNAQTPSGEAGFKHLSWNLGWALRPMISRIHQISKEIPITFIYGSRSWMDRKTAWDIKNIRHGCYVDVQVLRGAGHHVYAERHDLFNLLVKSIASSVDKGELPTFDTKLLQIIRDFPSDADQPDDQGIDIDQVPGHGDENTASLPEQNLAGNAEMNSSRTSGHGDV